MPSKSTRSPFGVVFGLRSCIGFGLGLWVWPLGPASALPFAPARVADGRSEVVYTAKDMAHAAQRLDLGAIKAALLRRVHTPLGELEVERLAPLPTLSVACEQIEAVSQARVLIGLREPPPVWGAQDVRAALDLGEKGIVLDGVALRAIADTLRAASAVRSHLTGHEQVAPLLYGLAAVYPDLGRLAGEVSRCFDPDGQLGDHASSELGPLRQKVRALKERIQAQIGEMLRSPEMQALLQEVYYTLRSDRYVLPIKASFKNEVRGIVHDASGSGQTVYIEPQAVVDLGNRLKIAQSEQEEEEYRILSRLTGLVAQEGESIRAMVSAIGRIDFLTSAATLAEDLDARPIPPTEPTGFHLVDARHPLLLLQDLDLEAQPPPSKDASGPDSVPSAALARRALRASKTRVVGNDLSLKPGQRVLILTGPNTGGKTVAMKTIGIFALMARSGLHLPCAEGSRIGWFDRIEVAIGDLQSIASNLSTFAAHISEVIEILRRSDSRTLVLIDEIGSDTDPMQGQALARALLEQLADQGAHAVVTTHFERLKAVPFVDARFRNAGAGFDAVHMRPTYRLTLDVPKSSSGLDIAAALGVPASVITRAKELAGEGSTQIETLLLGLERRAGELEEAKNRADDARRRAEEDSRKARCRERDLAEAIENLERKAHRELFAEIEGTRAKVRSMIARLQNAEHDLSARDAMRLANEASSELAELQKAEEHKLDEALPPTPGVALSGVAVGDRVHIPSLGREADVVEVAGKEIHVAIGNMRMRVPLADLRPAKAGRDQRRGRSKSQTPRLPARPEGPQEPLELVEEFDVRGHSVDEALARLDAFLDHHYDTATTHVRIIHGIGTGALRDAIRSHLRRSGYVKSLRPALSTEGGDGATIAALT